MSADIENEPVVRVEIRGRLGLLTLNRPRAINALSHEMVAMISAALARWRDDPAVATIAVVGSGDRGLCAGGDVLSLYRDVRENDARGAARFWRDEYALNHAISTYPKPYVAIQDGLVLGGGVGISAHGSHRVATERTRIGFPETTIGFVPDVGATWLLSRAPGLLGTRLALSSETVGADDAIRVGLSDAFVPADRIPRLLSALESEDPDTAIALLGRQPEAGALAEQQSWTDDAFAAPTVPEVLDRLRDSRLPEAVVLADTLELKSPTAVMVTFEAMRRVLDLPDLEAALRQEYRVSLHAATAPDFAEGVRAQLVDKDRAPHWSPPAFDKVDRARVGAYFETPPGGDLDLTGDLHLAGSHSKEHA